jgi:hypothetical protein
VAHSQAFQILEKLMKTQVVYAFASGQIANRFLNTLKFWSVADVDAKLYRGGEMVLVSYRFEGKGFDVTCSELDDLAGTYEGREVSTR